MKTIVVLLAAIMIFSILSSSPTLASPPSFGSRIDSFMYFIYRHVYPFSVTFFTPVGIESINDTGGEELRGDADDYANGKDGVSGEGTGKDQVRSGLDVHSKTQPENKLLFGRQK